MDDILKKAQAFVDRKYVARADERQKSMGLAYIEAERQDLAREIAGFADGLFAWQPIETAPKDGTEVIGIYYRPAEDGFKRVVYGPWTMAWDHNHWRSSWDGSEVIEYMNDPFGTDYKDLDSPPTHWMPLPAPPKG